MSRITASPRAIFFKGRSVYDGTRVFIDQAAQALRRRGWEVLICDLTDPEVSSAFVSSPGADQKIDLLFSINILGEWRMGDRPLADAFGARHVVWHVDNMISQIERLDQTPAQVALLAVDPTQIDAVHQLYGPERFNHVGFMPHAAVGEATDDDLDSQAFADARPAPILACCTIAPPAPPPWSQQDAVIRRLFDDAVDHALSVEWVAPLDALDMAIKARGVDPADPDCRSIRLSATEVDCEVRLRRRERFFCALVASGLPLVAYGPGWERLTVNAPHVVLGGQVSMSDVPSLMRLSRVVVNTNGNFGAGSHERPFTGMLAGAAVVSDYSRFYASAFEEDKDIALFRWMDLDGAMQKIARLAADPACPACAQRPG